jgi:hypothetical protein
LGLLLIATRIAVGKVCKSPNAATGDFEKVQAEQSLARTLHG